MNAMTLRHKVLGITVSGQFSVYAQHEHLLYLQDNGSVFVSEKWERVN